MEITSVAVLFVGIWTLQFSGMGFVTGFSQSTREAFMKVAERDPRPEELVSLAASMLASGMGTVLPLIAAASVAGIFMNVVQVGPLLSLKPLEPDFSRIDPMKGIQRLVSMRSLVELGKALVKLCVTGFVAYQVVMERFPTLVGLQAASVQGMAMAIAALTVELAQKVGLALLVMAAVDFFYQRQSFEGSLKMSREEVKEEFRHSEGDPHLKAKLRAMAREMASRRMMQSVPNADVVLTNPTHFAVALEYKPERMGAPVVVAKGQDLVAAEIKRVAKESRVPIIENPPLARALFRSVEIGDGIPPSLYQAVAEVLAFIYRLRDQAKSDLRAPSVAAPTS